MKITQDVREYAKTHGLEDGKALTAGMEEMADEFVKSGAEIYHRT
jgi:phosphomethylpyrimidine synthase